MVVRSKNTLWQSDITYFSLNNRFYYLVFILDVYTRQIVGYAVSDHLRAEANLRALKMAISGHGAPKVHHSDRGSQYIDKRYIKMLRDYSVEISMGYQAQDNAYAERINGTIKNDYLKHWDIKSFDQLKRCVNKAVKHYNSLRIHDSLPARKTPDEFSRTANTFKVAEEIYARERFTPKEKLFFWSDEKEEIDLYCNIN